MSFDFYRWNLAKFRKATRHLDPFQDGCYRRLIDEYMDTREPLPDNDIALANICRIPVERWLADASSIIRAFFKQKNGLLFHDYCDEELDYQDSKAKFRSENAKNAATKRWAKNKDLDADRILEECSPMLDKRQEIREEVGGKPPTAEEPKILPPLFEQFWEIFPKKRRDSKNKTLPAYLKAIKRAPEVEIYEAACRYSTSDEATKLSGQYAKGTIAWLNADRWTVEYSPANSNQTKPANGRTTYADSIRDAGEAALDNVMRNEKIRQEMGGR